MPQSAIAKYLSPWTYRREREAERVQSLRNRDGEACARCRRPLRFDLTDGHDHGPRVEQIAPGSTEPANLRLTHRRCNAPGLGHTMLSGEILLQVVRSTEGRRQLLF